MNDIYQLLESLKLIHALIRDDIVAAFERHSLETLSEVAHEASEDTIYAVDKISETRLIELFTERIASVTTIVLIGEGIPEGKIVLPKGAKESDAIYRIIIDPIDGTRGLMYQKRSAWILTGVAPNKGESTRLTDIELALQTEIPLVKQHLADVLWAVRGEGAFAERFNRLTGERKSLRVQPSRAKTLAHGFSTISRFFPGTGVELSEIEAALVEHILGPVRSGKAHTFEDQYISTAGQLYEIMMGHDRFIADLRPLMEQVLNRRGLALGLCCHPYDICTVLIANELGIVISQPDGQPINFPLDIYTDVAWVGYANEDLRDLVMPVLQTLLRERNLIE